MTRFIILCDEDISNIVLDIPVELMIEGVKNIIVSKECYDEYFREKQDET